METADISTKAPTWPYHGSLLSEISIVTWLPRRRRAPSGGRWRRRRLRVARGRADGEPHQIPVAGWLDGAVDDLDRPLEPLARFQIRHVIRQRAQRRRLPRHREVVAVLRHRDQPQAIGQRLAHLVENVDRSLLPAAQLL